MEDIAKWFAANPWGIILLATCTVGGLILGAWGLYLAYAYAREKRPCYAVKSNNLITGLNNQHPDVEVTFKGYGQPIENLTISQLLFWNHGREPIRKTDVSKASPLVIKLADNCLILNVQVILVSRPENQFVVQRSADRKQATITFDYVDRLEGVAIQVIHTGAKSEDVAIEGTIIGGGGTPRRISEHPGRPVRPIEVLAFASIGLVCAISLGMVLNTPNIETRYGALVHLIPVLAFGVFLGADLLRRRQGPPRDLIKG